MNEDQIRKTTEFKLLKTAYKTQSRDDLLMIIYKLMLKGIEEKGNMAER